MGSTNWKLVAQPDWLGERAPRIWSVPEFVSTAGLEALDLCELAGLHLDPYQQFVLVNSLGERIDGKWAAFEVGVNVARQNGKNEIAIARELVGLFLLKEGLLIHSAHEFKTSTEHQRRLEEIIQNTPEFHKRVKPRGYRHSHGEEGIELRTGQRIRFMTRTKGGGRGHTGDLVVLDEAMILAAAMLGALMPTLSARSVEGNPQLWYLFTAVDKLIHEHGTAAARIRERGIEGDRSLAYFEWSADCDDPDEVSKDEAADPRLWLQANPALNVRISEEHVANEQRSMDPRTFAVERLGVGDWPAVFGSSVIDLHLWASLVDGKSQPRGPLVFAFDVSPDRAWASICVAGHRPDGLPHIEVMEHRRGTGWVVPWLTERVARHKPLAVVCDGASPAGSLIPDLERAKVTVDTVTGGEYAAGCGIFYDAVQQERLRHLGTPELDSAVRGASTRPLGDSWAWSRKNSGVNITPLVGCTLALWGLSTRAQKGAPRVIDLASV